MSINNKKIKQSNKIHIPLLFLDFLVMLFTNWFMLCFYKGEYRISDLGALKLFLLSSILVFTSRAVFRIYNQVWRYGGIQSYIKMLISDAVAFPFVYLIERYFFTECIAFPRCLSIICVNLLFSLAMRMFYRYAYKYGNSQTLIGKTMKFLLKVFTLNKLEPIAMADNRKINVAIIGAGSTGTTLAEELIQSTTASYNPVCFVDTDKEKIGREIYSLPILDENDKTLESLEDYGIQEVIFTIPASEAERRKSLYSYYKKAGYRIKVYDYPSVESASKKRQLREFDAEELLFRKPITILNDKTTSYYKNKVILITGGGGSIGSELCRQITKMEPKQIVILDIYENGAYDVQQELRIANKDLKINVEIVSVTNIKGLERVFEEYRPQIVLNAAAHKHVPLMEKNCIEAVENNIFGTLNTVKVAIKYGCERVIMVSTDKAVNPTNVMGATKRMCEMIVRAYSETDCDTTFSITRFGNVLGSAGSVIPLFKKQILHGGPITITDKRIIRYFMTIPEASQLVLTSGAMANNGQLFVLDMGQPVKILDLAENMIRLSGMEPYKDIEIIETGLRPGEKLYEELLVKTETLGKTENSLIFTEQDEALSIDEIEGKLNILIEAIKTDDDSEVRKALMSVVPTFKDADTVNKEAEKAEEMKNAK